MGIIYRDTKEFNKEQLFELFSSVGWASAKYPDKLVTAMRNSETVISAWDGGALIGLMSAMSDGIMTVYFHWLLVHPDYQKRGVGKAIVDRMLEHYEDYVSRILISYNEQVGFYERCGFEKSTESAPMKIMGIKTNNGNP